MSVSSDSGVDGYYFVSLCFQRTSTLLFVGSNRDFDVTSVNRKHEAIYIFFMFCETHSGELAVHAHSSFSLHYLFCSAILRVKQSSSFFL